MRQHIIKPKLVNNKLIADLPRGVNEFKCYVTTSEKVPQHIPYKELFKGHHFYVQNHRFISEHVVDLQNSLILIVESVGAGKICITCRNQNSRGPFCSKCGLFLS